MDWIIRSAVSTSHQVEMIAIATLHLCQLSPTIHPTGCWDAQMIDAIAPDDDEIVLPKTSSSVFNSTNIHYLLRNMSVTHLVLCGCVTDQCVEHAVRDACDLGYYVTLVPGGLFCGLWFVVCATPTSVMYISQQMRVRRTLKLVTMHH